MIALRATLAAGVCLTLAAGVRADTLDQVRQRGTLRWGGDQEGGGPYIYPDPKDPGRVIGFEVELMELLAARLGVRSQFQQGEWDSLPNQLSRGDVDVIANGFELTAAHLQTRIATIPYYIYDLQLIARRDDPSVQSWEGLKRPGPHGQRIVGVLGPAAQAYVDGRLGKGVAKSYPGATQALEDVQNGRIDATAQDLPAALFYQNRFPALHFVDEPVDRGFYVIYLRRGDERLRDALNAGLLDLLRSGQLRALYERYGLWSATQERLGEPGLGLDVKQSTETHGWAVVADNLPVLLKAAGMTVLLTCLSMPLAIILGLLIAVGRLYGPGPLRWLLGCYVEVLRGTPLLMQLFTLYYVLPLALGVRLDAISAAVLGLAINYSAYEAENYRAGLLAIPIGQMEAALSLGMSRATALRRIIIPQAVRIVIPPVTNDFIALFKDTSICSVIAVTELSKQYSILVNSTHAYLELAGMTALLYLLMSYPLSLLARRLERRFPRLAV